MRALRRGWQINHAAGRQSQLPLAAVLVRVECELGVPLHHVLLCWPSLARAALPATGSSCARSAPSNVLLWLQHTLLASMHRPWVGCSRPWVLGGLSRGSWRAHAASEHAALREDAGGREKSW